MGKNRALLPALGIALFLSICANIVLIYFVHQYRNPVVNIVGTYCNGDEKNEETAYFAFKSDGTYVQYRQFHMMDKGTYCRTGNGLYTLTSESGSQHALWVQGNSLYNPCDGNVTVYTKIDNVPNLINVTE